MTTKPDQITEAIYHCFESLNVTDSNLEPANLVDTTADIAAALHRIGAALERLAAASESREARQ